MTATDRLRATFDVDEAVVSAFSDAEPSATTAQDRLRLWLSESWRPRRVPEYLLPRVVRRIERERPPFMDEHRGHLELSAEDLRARVNQLGPWDLPFRLRGGQTTMGDDLARIVATSRILFRRDLITGTVVELLGARLPDTTVLDMGCNCGFFSLDIAARGAKQVCGIDLRRENIARARFLAEHYGIENVDFEVGDATDLCPGRQWDVVLNLGVLYHVTEPLQLLRRTYALCRDFAVIDTLCHPEPVSAFLVVAEKDVNRATEGRDAVELLPTYRAAIDVIRYAGFSEVIELIGTAAKPHRLYAHGTRRCFLAIK